MKERGGWSADEAAELAGLLASIQRVVRRRLRQEIFEPRLRGAEIELLRIVISEPGIGVNGAAQQLHLAGNSVSTLVNRLVRSGFLLRTPDPDDRRAARLEATDAARERISEWQRRRRELFSEVLEDLTSGERTALRDAIPALHHLAESLTKEADRA